MENNEVCIKSRTCYYFDNITKLEEFDFDNVLADEKSHENILINDNIVNPKSSIIYVFSNYYAKIKVDSYDSLKKNFMLQKVL